MTEQSDSKEADQAAKDAAVTAAFEAWRNRPKDLDAEAVTALWEAMWEVFDFSWEGLADAGWERGDEANEAQTLKRWRAPFNFPGVGTIRGEGQTTWREATLQDYWRWSLGFEGDATGQSRLTDYELEVAGLLLRKDDGTLWHRLHLPPNAHRENSDDLWASAASEESVEKRVVAREGELTLMARARLATGLAMLENDMGADRWEGALRLIGARAAELSEILRSNSLSDVSEQRTCPRITVDARFAGFLNLDMHGAQFRGVALFAEALFKEAALFSWAEFLDGASFEGALFQGDAWFGSVQFRNTVYFDEVQFYKTVWFGEAQFHNRAEFGRAQFHDYAGFNGAQFERIAYFTGAQFQKAARFNGTRFRDEAVFEAMTFAEKCGAGPIRFRTAMFSKLADFSGCRFPNQPERIQGAFETTRFLEEARFLSPDFDAFSAFNGAVFKGKLLLAAARTDREEQRRFDAVLRVTKAAVKEDQRIKLAADYDPEKDDRAEERGANNRFAALEGGLRVLKTAMEAEKDHMQEHRFFRFELQAKRRRPSVSRLEKAASWSYGLLSDYGNSMGRPLFWLIVSVFLFCALYWGWSRSLDPSTGWWQVVTAWEVSIRNVVQPFAPWAATKLSPFFNLDVVEVVRCGGAPSPVLPGDVACPTGGGFGWLAFRLVATLQSVVSLLLAFLFALALRKKFQIS